MSRLRDDCFAYWLSMGMDDERAGVMADAQTALMSSIAELEDLDRRQEFLDATSNGLPDHLRNMRLIPSPSVYGISDELLLHDEIMVEWEKFIAACSGVAVSYEGHVSLMLEEVELDGEVAETFLGAFKSSPLRTLYLKNCDGWKFASNALEMNHAMSELIFAGNPIESEVDSIAIAEAVSNHPKMRQITLRNCDLGRRNDVMSAFVPLLQHCRYICFDGNDIGLDGATLLANCLATNPVVEFLSLVGNLLTDEAVSMLAKSLETNRNLRSLRVAGNEFADIGLQSLRELLYGGRNGLNRIAESNHTCLFDVIAVNLYPNPSDNKLLKLLFAIIGCPFLLEDLPIELMPRLLAFLQRGEALKRSNYNYFGSVFRVVRNFNATVVSSVGRKLGPSVVYDTTDQATTFDESAKNALEGTEGATSWG